MRCENGLEGGIGTHFVSLLIVSEMKLLFWVSSHPTRDTSVIVEADKQQP